ncbi:MAG: hypothetical protein GIW99_07465 [Candidatus Eremiobacteraeota bacterium]|nr:hypothetical protein [Candidatus Eremiobacteraeota bacterium]MBC5827502.1 hypothetical protein [Candidatus Eremiobacteraeota bacterium]
MCDFIEQSGSYIKYGMLDADQYLDLSGAYVWSMWQRLQDVVAMRRVARNSDEMYENFEYLAALVKRRGAKASEAFPATFHVSCPNHNGDPSAHVTAVAIWGSRLSPAAHPAPPASRHREHTVVPGSCPRSVQ